MNQHDWLNLVHTIHTENRYGKTLILDLQKIRANSIKFNFKNNVIHQRTYFKCGYNLIFFK